MMVRRRVPIWQGIVLLWAVALAACAPLIAEYSLEAYRNATTLKAETVALIDKSTEPYSRHAEAAEALSVRIAAAHEFAAGLPANQISARQWALMRDPDRALFGGFVRFWRSSGTVSPAFRDEYRGQISEAFDYIICLEANKQSRARCPAPAGAEP